MYQILFMNSNSTPKRIHSALFIHSRPTTKSITIDISSQKKCKHTKGIRKDIMMHDDSKGGQKASHRARRE
ncbi:hypothetical protein A4A49_32952 [Nicotiana attenuata]|uniref:Uncharacterized protein n=1 Tax=Nicotiana attenuata TaxID=49451 RepID=A0A1J6JZC2_NICAT|nr:hypothetical protein A4A49_32952 [Nicotiana attenuata]